MAMLKKKSQGEGPFSVVQSIHDFKLMDNEGAIFY